MDIKKRLFRRPFTTVLWLALVMVMAVSLCVGTTLSYSTSKLIPMLDDAHTTIATRNDKAFNMVTTPTGTVYSIADIHFNAEDYDFFMGLDSVENVYFHSLTGGYIPELSSVLGLDANGIVVGEGNESYDGVVFTATVESVYTTSNGYGGTLSYLTEFGLTDNEEPTELNLSIKIDEVIAAHPDTDFSRVQRNMTISSVYGQEAVDYIKKGDKYLFVGRISGGRFIHVGERCNTLQNGVLTGHSFVDGVDENGTPYIYSSIESVPLVQRIETTAEDTVAANPELQKFVKMYSVAASHMPITGTDNLDAVYIFNSGDAAIVQGRGFLPEEYQSGAKVCLISETVALKSGVSVGDTLHISQYLIDESSNASLSNDHLDGMMNNPTVGVPKPDYEYKTQSEEFKVIGLYRQTNEWDETSSFAFTPNTVFIPKKAQIEGGYGRISVPVFLEELNGFVNRESGCHGVLFSMKLKNGSVEDFKLAIAGTKWENEFNIFDQGYDGAIKAMEGTAESARSLMLFSMLGWIMILLLYILLYQGVQRKNIGIMRSLGANPKQARRYLYISGLAVAAAGITAGIAASAFINRYINNELSQIMSAEGIQEPALAELMSNSSLPVWVLVLLGLAQIAIFAAIMWLHANSLSRKAPRKLIGG